MKIYVSDKEIDDNVLNYVEDDFVEEYFLSRGMSKGKGFEICDHVGLVEIQSLEQHEQEIRRPLEDEIERLKKENQQLIKDNRLLDETKYTAQQDDIDFFVEQERLKVIAELEEWLHKQSMATYWLNNNESEEHLPIENLKQKLKEMKGESE